MRRSLFATTLGLCLAAGCGRSVKIEAPDPFDLASEFRPNPVAGEESWKDKVVSFSGAVAEIQPFQEEVRVEFAPLSRVKKERKQSLSGKIIQDHDVVHITFYTTRSEAAKLKTGQNVTMKGFLRTRQVPDRSLLGGADPTKASAPVTWIDKKGQWVSIDDPDDETYFIHVSQAALVTP